jgi:hypothetical protein
MHLRVLYAALSEPGFSELPIEVLATVFNYVTEAYVFSWVLKMIKDRQP